MFWLYIACQGDLNNTSSGYDSTIEYEHPMFTHDAIAQREKLIEMNGSNRTWYAGAYMGNGFHEDAVRSAVHIAAQLGCAL